MTRGRETGSAPACVGAEPTVRLRIERIELPRVFPNYIVVEAVTFAPAEADDPGTTFAVPDIVRASVPKRRREFVAGRLCARKALHAAGSEATDHIGVGTMRAPIWPGGFVGSITHTNGIAASAVAGTDVARSIGLDIESIISGDGTPSIAGAVAEPDELGLAITAGVSPHVALTAVFCAKEALYKCLAPVVRRVFDFLDVAVVSAEPGTLSLRLRTRLGEHFCERDVITARFAVFREAVVAGVLLGV